MGLFSKRSPRPAEQVSHRAVARFVHVRAGTAEVVEHLARYAELTSPRHGRDEVLQLSSDGEWTTVRLPDTVHPWQLHNLATWMIDCAGATAVVAESAAGPDHPAYRLVPDPEIADSLCGWDADGAGWTVHAPANDVVRPEPVPVVERIEAPIASGPWRPVVVRLEDPGHALNPTNAATFASRARLRDRHGNVSW